MTFKTYFTKKHFKCGIAFMLVVMLIIPLRWVGVFSPLPIGATFGLWSSKAIENSWNGIAEDINALGDLASLVARVEVIDKQSIVLPHGHHRVRYNSFHLYQLKILEVYKGDVDVGEVVSFLQPRALHGHSFLSIVFNQIWWLVASDSDSRGQGRSWSWHNYARLPIHVGDDLIVFLARYKDYTDVSLGFGTRGANGIVAWPDTRYPFFSPRSSIEHIQPQVEQNRYLQSKFFLVNPVQGAYWHVLQELRNDCDFVFESVSQRNNLILTEKDLLQITENN